MGWLILCFKSLEGRTVVYTLDPKVTADLTAKEDNGGRSQ